MPAELASHTTVGRAGLPSITSPQLSSTMLRQIPRSLIVSMALSKITLPLVYQAARPWQALRNRNAMKLAVAKVATLPCDPIILILFSPETIRAILQITIIEPHTIVTFQSGPKCNQLLRGRV